MNSLLYNIKQGFTQIFRNKGMSLASIFSILAMLLILGIFFLITVNLNLFTEVVKQDYDQVEIFMLDGASEEQLQNAMDDLKKQDGVAEVTYSSRTNEREMGRKRLSLGFFGR